MCIAEFGHKFTSFYIPHRDEATIVSRHDCLKFTVVQSERNGVLVTCLNFFLRLEEPKVDLSRAS